MKQQQRQNTAKDAEDQQTAGVLSQLILALVATCFVLFLSGLYGNDWRLVAVAGIGLFSQVLPFLLIKSGKLFAGSIILVVFVLALVTVFATIGQGIRDVALVTFPVIYIFASLTFNRFILRATLALTMVSISWLVLGEHYGWFIPFQLQGKPGWPELLMAAVVLLVAWLAVYLLAMKMRRNLDRVKAREERFKVLFDKAPVAMVRTRFDGSAILEVNQRLAELSGYSRQELLDKPFSIFWAHPEKQQGPISLMKKNGHVDNYEFDLIDKLGGIRNCLGNFKLSLEKDYLEISIIDITGRKRVEARLNESETRLGSAIKAAGFGVYEFHHATNEANYSPEFMDIYGLSHNAVLELGDDLVPRAIHPDDKTHFLAAMKQGNDPGGDGVMNTEYRIIRQDGQVRWLHVQGKTTFSDSGPALPIVAYGFIRDITKRKRVEQELIESQALLSAVFESTSDLIWSVDCKSFGLLNYNQSLRDYIHHHTGVLVEKGMRPEDMFSTDEYIDKWHGFYDRALNDGAYSTENLAPKGDKDLLLNFNLVKNNGVVSAISVFANDITQRKKAEDTLKDNETKFRSAFMTGLDASYFATLEEGLIIEVNDNFEQVWGYSKAEVIGKTFLELGLYHNYSDRARLVSQLKARGSVRDMELTGRKKSGELITISVSVSILTLNGKQHILGIIRDITARKQAEQALAKSESLYHDTFDNAPLGLFHSTEDGKFIFVNSSLARMLGFKTPAEMVSVVNNTSIQQALYLDPQKRARIIADNINTPGWVYSENEYRRTDGSIFTARLMVRFVKNPDGTVDHIEGMVEDITDRLKAERALTASEAHFRTVVETAMDGYWLANTKGNLLEVNDSYCRMSGYSRGELLAMPLPALEAEANLDETIERIQKLIENGQDRFETRHRRKDGGIIDLDISVKYRSDDGGRMEVFLRDITEGKRAEKIREMGRLILQILNEQADVTDSIKRILSALKAGTGLDAVGIRLQDGDDFPYFVQEGFTRAFLSTENTLIERAAGGGVCRDQNGCVNLECTCGQVISGKTGSASDYMTKGGSCWSNDKAVTPFQDTRLHPRDRCLHDGYKSVALVPIREKERIVGLIQLNDRREGCFTLEIIEYLESIASHIGTALMRKASEEKIKASLAEKEVILKEIHHRVKNNMQVISSLLQLQSGFVKDKQDALMFQESQRRIYSMSLVYNKLYQSDDLANIGFEEYATDLVKSLVKAYNFGPETIKTFIDIKDIKLGLDLAVPCGLIINEVITNSLKHAFPSGRGGCIHVCIKQTEDQIEMSLGDNGVGLPKGLTFGNTNSLGMVLIQTLAENQLGGKLELNLIKGTEYLISFPFKSEKIKA